MVLGMMNRRGVGNNMSKTRIFQHKVQYYETDKMGVTHHSNYVRWMEEARVYFLEEIGWGYDRLERAGLISPVISVECKYKATTTFPEVIDIEVGIEEFSGIKMKIWYRMKNSEGKPVFEGKTELCYLNEKGIPVRLQKAQPAFYEAIMKYCEM